MTADLGPVLLFLNCKEKLLTLGWRFVTPLVSDQPGHFLPANRKPNRTEPHRTEISVCSVFCCRFGLWFCTVRCSASASAFYSNRTEEPNKPKCMLQTRKLETPPSPHALSPSRPIVPRPIKTQRKPPSRSSVRRGSAAAAHPARSDARHSLTLNR